jgi:hypothetical protein
MLTLGKKYCDTSAATECTFLAIMAFKKEQEKGKLRSLMQKVVSQLKVAQQSYAEPTDLPLQPTAILHDTLKKRIALALKWR